VIVQEEGTRGKLPLEFTDEKKRNMCFIREVYPLNQHEGG